MATDFTLPDSSDPILDMEESLSGEFALAEIYKSLTINDDIIVVINACDEDLLRKGLSSIRYREQRQLRDAGLGDQDMRTLEFKVLPITQEMTEEQLRIQIYLKTKNMIKVHSIHIADKEL